MISVLNLSYADDAMDRHLEVLLDRAERRDRGEDDEEDVYVRGEAALARWLLYNDTPAVVEELKQLRNVRYYDRPVSIYGRLVGLPLLVRREDGAGWFDDMDC